MWGAILNIISKGMDIFGSILGMKNSPEVKKTVEVKQEISTVNQAETAVQKKDAKKMGELLSE